MQEFADHFSNPRPLEAFKQAIKAKNAELRDKFDPNASVNRLLREKSDFIDGLLRAVWRHFLGEQASLLALIAVGGFGRRELFPYSDIDLLILVPETTEETYSEDLAGFTRFLWDIGLKPAYSTHTVQECAQAARDDQTIMTSLIEARHIEGRAELLEALRQATAPQRMWPPERFLEAKLNEQRKRYAKFHDTAYNLEPNIKEGPGGLRDIQLIDWIFRRYHPKHSLVGLIEYGFLAEEEYHELIMARHTLWRLRYALHVLTGRCEDRLLFDHQRDLARWFGFGESGSNQDVERFMQHYFKTVVGLERLNEMLLQLLSERLETGASQPPAIPINAKFKSVGHYIEIAHEHVFKSYPPALLEIFLTLQQVPSLRGVRATTIRLIRKHLYLIDDEFRANPVVCRLFMDILRQPRGVTRQLRRMNRYGVLAAYLPAFSHIVARMQYDLFHIYTVDEHTLFVIRNLRRFALPEYHNDDLPLCHNIFLLIPKPHLLYIAAMFHDIAKGKGGDHSELGEQIAREFCQRHLLSESDTKLVAWLVRHHLLMSMTAQRKDISDPAVIHAFASQVESISRLNYLYLLTVADIRATNPELWNSWKNALLIELYTATHHAIRSGLQSPADQAARLAETQQEALNELKQRGVSEHTVRLAWTHISDDYFLRFSADEIVWHTIAIATHDTPDEPLIVLRPLTLRGSAEVFIYSHYKETIFSLSTAELDQLGLTILDARIVHTKDNFQIHSFQILEQSGQPIDDLIRQIHICVALRKVLREGRTAQRSNVRHQASRQAKHFPIPTRIAFHDDPQSHHTVLELITTDRAGLLSKVGQGFLQQGIRLHSAKITTIGSRVEDMFYISGTDGLPITAPAQQQHLSDAIMQALGEVPATPLSSPV